MIKKLTSILLVVMLLATLTPSTIFAATTPEEISATYGSYVRGRQDNGQADKVLDGSALMYAATTAGTDKSNEYFAFLIFDFSGYESKIQAANDIKLKIVTGKDSGYPACPFNVSVLPDSADTIILDKTTLTYNSLSSNKLNTLGTTVMSNTETLSTGTTVSSDNIKEYIIAAFEENPENSTVSFRISGEGATLSSFYGYPYQKIALEYDTDAVDNSAYVQSKANSLDWSDISNQPEDSITDNLTLPSKLYGADVTWVSNDAAITSDGTVTLPKGDAQEVTLTANLNYNGATASKPFTVTVPAAPANSETISYVQRAHIRGGSYAGDVQGVNSGEIYLSNYGYGNTNDRYAFYQFNLSGLEDKIENATKATLTIKGNWETNAFAVSLLSDKCDSWSSATLTYNLANELGMLSNSSNSTDVQSGITLAANTEYTTGDFADSLRSAIADNPTNSIVTFRFYNDTSTVVTLKYATVTLNLEYYDEDLDSDALFESKKDTLAWDDVTTQSIDNVTEDLTLPTKLYGFDLTWKSDNTAIDALTGKVTQLKSGDTTVNLTATVTNGTVTHDKTFTVTVPAVAKSTFTLDYADRAATRGGTEGDKVQNLAYGTSFGWVNANKAGLNDDNDRYIYYSFDLSDNEEKIMKATDVNLSFTPSEVSGGTWQLAILPETNYNWSSETLTYNLSNALGMMDEAILIQQGIKVAAGETYTSTDFASALKQVLTNNPANSVVTLRIYAESNLASATGLKNIVPKLNISYYDMDLNSDAFFADIKDDLAWDDITTQPIDSVVADIKLPSKFYGYDVTWASGNDAAINSAGEVTVGDSKTAVKLTATITNGTNTYSKDFEVTVSDKAYALDFSNALGSGAKVYAAADTTAVLVFAAYADKTLLSVASVDVTLADGENLVNSLLRTTGATEVKIMLLSDMDSLTPLCTYKAK